MCSEPRAPVRDDTVVLSATFGPERDVNVVAVDAAAVHGFSAFIASHRYVSSQLHGVAFAHGPVRDGKRPQRVSSRLEPRLRYCGITELPVDVLLKRREVASVKVAAVLDAGT
jgi:hypothetical protein